MNNKKLLKIILIIMVAIIAIICVINSLCIVVNFTRTDLICVGTIKLNCDYPSYTYQNRSKYRVCSMSEIEDDLKRYRDKNIFLISDDEVDCLLDELSNYKDYPTVVISEERSNYLWTSKTAPYITYIHVSISPVDLNFDNKKDRDVLYVYVSKCTVFGEPPIGW